MASVCVCLHLSSFLTCFSFPSEALSVLPYVSFLCIGLHSFTNAAFVFLHDFLGSCGQGKTRRRCCHVTRFGRDCDCASDVIIFTENDCRVSPTTHRKAGPTTAVYPASITGSGIGVRSVTPMQISFDASRKNPIPLKGCVLWNRRAFMVRTMASAKDKWRGRTWSREDKNFEREALPFGWSRCNARLSQQTCEQQVANLCYPHPQPDITFVFCMRTQESAKAQAVRNCAARVWIFGTPQNHESHGCSRNQSMRARRSKFAVAALADITLEGHEICYGGGEIITATLFPTETSCRILVRTRGCVTSYMGPNFVSSTWPRKTQAI